LRYHAEAAQLAIERRACQPEDFRCFFDASIGLRHGLPQQLPLELFKRGSIGTRTTGRWRAADRARQDVGGHDTVEANHLLGFGDDERDYDVAADMLRILGVRSVQLMTNNPRKVEGLRQHGIVVSGRTPIVTAANRFNASYLLAKQKRSGHWLGMQDLATVAQPPASLAPLTVPEPERLVAGGSA